MTTNNRVARFDNEKISIIEQSGSVRNDYLFENGTLRTNVDSEDPNKSLASFPVGFYKFSNQKIYELFDSKFSEFVEEPQTEQSNIFTEEQLSFLRTRLDELTGQLDDTSGFISLSNAQKTLIIELRIMLGQGETESDFSSEFPYNPWPEYLREKQRSGEGGYGNGYPTRTNIIRGDSRVVSRGGGLLDVVVSPEPVSNVVVGDSVPAPADNTSPATAETVNDLPSETISYEDVSLSPENLTENTLILESSTETPEENVVIYDENNNIATDEEEILPTDPIIKKPTTFIPETPDSGISLVTVVESPRPIRPPGNEIEQ